MNQKEEIENFGGIVVTQGSFALKKLVLKEDKSCDIEFLIARISTTEKSYVITAKMHPKYMAGQPLLDELHKLKSQLLKVRSIPLDKEKKVNVVGLVLKGSEDTRNYKILGTEKSDNEQSMSLDTHVIHFKEGTYGNEDKIRDICDEIEVMAWKYLFKQEKAQLELVLDSDSEYNEICEVEFEEENENTDISANTEDKEADSVIENVEI